MTSYMQTYAQRTAVVQHLMLYLLQITKFIPETFSTSSKLIEIISELSKKVPLLRPLEIIPKPCRNIKNIFSTISKYSETFPLAQKYFLQLSLIEIIPRLQEIRPNSFSPRPMKSSSYKYTPHPEYQ